MRDNMIILKSVLSILIFFTVFGRIASYYPDAGLP
jgi:hypothetical protein